MDHFGHPGQRLESLRPRRPGRPRHNRLQTLRPAVHVFMLCLTAAACLATSRARPPTHRPVYMSWKEFRSAVKVLKPRPIRQRGKIFVLGKRLFISEPNRGLHVIDNTDPKAPRPMAFIRIPGNVDIAARGDHLYADSFVDLLVFRLEPNYTDIHLVRRIKGVFPYDYLQTLPRHMYIRPDEVDPSKGVVVGWKRIERKKQ